VKLSLYLDEDAIARALVAGLRARGVDVQTVVEAGLREILKMTFSVMGGVGLRL
jgi:hypothetical protein